MKTPIEYIIVAVPFHADAATHDELARKVNEKLNTGYELFGPPFLSEEMMYQAMTKPIQPGIPTTDPMKKTIPITTLFLDIGGVLLTNGWDHLARRRAAKHFKLNWAEMEERHSLNFKIYEEDKLTLDEYLGWLLFYQKRPFTRAEFRHFMFAQSKALSRDDRTSPQTQGEVWIEDHRAQQRSPRSECASDSARSSWTDLWMRLFPRASSTCTSPTRTIFRLALDIAQTPARQIVYIENTPMFVQIAEGLGIRSILHTDYKSTCAKLASFGLEIAG